MQIGSALCVSCGKNPANPGYGWCQDCFANKSIKLCSQCGTKPANPGHSWCQTCFDGGKRIVGTIYSGPPMCSNCFMEPPNPGHKWCQTCFAKQVSLQQYNKNLCTKCHKAPATTSSGLCGGCAQPQSHSVVHSSNGNTKHTTDLASIAHQFEQGWNKKYYGKPFKILGITPVNNPNIHNRYKNYARSLKMQNEKVWWHGSSFKCAIFESRNYCSDPSCAVCVLCTGGYLFNTRGTKSGAMKYGPGLYFTPDVCKGNDYTIVSPTGIRCMMLCKVLAGCPYFTTKKKITDLNQLPPKEYDSVLGEVSPGGLRYPELAVYNPNAVMVCYIVFYSC